LSIVVGPPEGVCRDAAPVDSDNVRPVIIVRVNSDLDAHGFALRDHIEDELLICSLVRSPVIDLDVEPERAELGARVVQRVYGVDDLLLGGGAAGGVAWEQVRVDRALACGIGVLDVLDASVVNSAVALTNATDVEPVAVALKALEARRRDALNDGDRQ
ncbi:hypothetical protein PENTCL1PPCAC_15504, partial [Pristionchus entomophagus]